MVAQMLVQLMKIDMKKMNIGAFVVSGGLLLAASGCTESDFDSKYEDPSKVNQVTISNLMVGVFQKVKDYDVYEYGRFFGFDSQFVGKYAQTFGYSYSGGMYSPGYTPAIDGQWDNLYSALTQYRKMESLYNEENDTQKAQDEAFMLAAKVQLYDFFAATVDIFGDMPFSKACTLPLTNDVNGSYAPYDMHGFKTNGFTIEHFHQFQSKSSNERNKLFLSICERCYLEYSKRLKEKQAVDFEDMINSSAKMLREKEIQGERLGFKYIIVDEYQDISRQRFNLTLELSKLCDAKIVAVGDDWQSIYAYAGSDITLFTQFKESFGYGLELGITKTYRNAQEVIDIAGGFIQKNTAQIRKSLVSPKHITRPVVVETYTENVDRSKYAGKGGKYFLVGETVERIVGQILEENPDASILLLGRYGFDAFNLCRSSEFTYEEKTGNVISKKYPFAKLDFMTVHRAKGLGYDHVILINARNELYGFPSQVQDDPVLKYVVRDDHSMEYAEERRLFYVALTRTKNRVYIVVPQQHPSDFVRELVKDYPGVTVNGELDDCRETRTEMKRCPVCGYPMQLRYKKAYGLKLWICSNEPEICDFMTNNLKGGDLPILKCDCCKDGYLIVKEGWGEPFLGCTNYRADRSGCNRAISRDKYLRSVKPFFDE